MAARSKTDTCCLTLPLRLEKWQADRLAKRFHIAEQIYNAMLLSWIKKLRVVEQMPEYRAIQSQLQKLYEEDKQKTDAAKELFSRRKEILKKNGFPEYSFKTGIRKYYAHFKENIASNVATHCIASQVWDAFSKKLFGNGGRLHFKRAGDIHSLRGYSKSGESGGVEIIFRGTYIEWNGLRLPLKLDPQNPYEAEMLAKRVKYVRILRTPGKSIDHWYAQLALEGKPTVKRNAATGEPVHPSGRGAVGIDIGPRTIAYVSENEVGLRELADQVENIERDKRRLQRKLDRSRRATNPDNYAPDGTIKRGIKHTHNKSSRYRRMQKELSLLQHRQALIRKRQHTELANHLLSLGDCFYVEDMPWKGLARRAKETTVSPTTGRYRRKKRFGKSISNKAPGTLILILEQKCKSRGVSGVIRVPTNIKASQYNHMTDTYKPKPLSQRWNDMPDGKRIQRDLYSAFLLQHVTPELDGFERTKLIEDYDGFIHLHDKEIHELTLAPKTIASMGISRTRS